MKPEDWRKIARWVGLAYLPIVIIVAIVFLILQWQMRKIDVANSAPEQSSSLLATEPPMASTHE